MRQFAVRNQGAGKAGSAAVPGWIRWAAVAWLAVWFPTYAVYNGWANFTHLCDVAVMLSCAGLWLRSPLLLSSQAISSIGVDLLWTLDVAWRQLSGKIIIPGIEYMWDPQTPLWVRLISLFHVLLPFLLLWMVSRFGYDRRGFAMQICIAAVFLVAARVVGAEANINFSLRDPLFHRSWGPAPSHLALMLAGLIVILYWPTHLLLRGFFPPPEAVAAKG